MSAERPLGRAPRYQGSRPVSTAEVLQAVGRAASVPFSLAEMTEDPAGSLPCWDRLSVLIGRATGSITRGPAGEPAADHRTGSSGETGTRASLLLVGLAWLVSLVPWFVACFAGDAFGELAGRERGWLGAFTLAGPAAITAAAIYYGLRGFLAHEPIEVRRWEDGVSVIGFVLPLACWSAGRRRDRSRARAAGLRART